MKQKEWFSNFLQSLTEDGYSSSKRILIFTCTVFIILLLLPNIGSQYTSYQSEDVIGKDIWAKSDILVEDKNLTELKKQQLLSEIGLIFDYDPQLFEKLELRIDQAFAYLREKNQQLAEQREAFVAESDRLGAEYFLQKLEIREQTKGLQRWQTYAKFLETKVQLVTNNKTDRAFLRQWLQQQSLSQQNITQLEAKINLLTQTNQQVNSRLLVREEEQQKLLQSQQAEQKQHIDFFAETLKLEINSTEMQLFLVPFFNQNFQNILLQLLRPLSNTPVLQTSDNLGRDIRGKAKLINLENGENSFVEDIQNFQSINQVRSQIGQRTVAVELPPGIEQYSTLLKILAEQLAEPSLTINKLEIEKQKEQINNTSPVYTSYKKGENIARRGERLDNTNAQIVNSYLLTISEENQLSRFLGIVFLVVGLFAVLYLLLSSDPKTHYKNWALCVLSIFAALLVTKIQLWLLDSIASPWQLASYYSLPILFSTLLTGTLINPRVALYSGLVSSVFLTLLVGNDWAFFCYAVLSNFVAVLFLGKNISRLDLLKQSFQISLLHPLIVGSILLINNQALDLWFGLAVVASLIGGLISAVFVTFLMPLVELLLGVTTNFKLLELSTLNHPALQHLMFKAPGSYHHSVIVSNLAEAAALKVNANSLLVRVSAYYHDIGKSVSPQFFIENNEKDGQNVHNQLNDPKASAQLIIDHVKLGAEMAQKYKLGKAIENIITEHHGTNTVEYFLHEAQKKAGKNTTVDVKDFCYAGPKPGSLESAIVMLADTCEAATRSMNNHNRHEIEEKVSKVSQTLLDNGQLDESGINLKEFKEITKSFVNIIIAVHHPRVPYPKAQILKLKPWSTIKH